MGLEYKNRIFRSSRTTGTACFYLILVGLILFYVAVALFPGVQQFYMQKFHPGRLAYGAWASMQLIPSMYSFENQVDVRSAQESVTLWTNHYPMRPLFFRLDRARLKTGGPFDVTLASRYRGVILHTRYRLAWSGHAFDVIRNP